MNHINGRTAIVCPICASPCVQIGSVSMFRQEPGEKVSSAYYRLDPEHGVVAMHHNDPSQPVHGRLVIVQVNGDCGHSFDLVFHNVGTQTLFFQSSDHQFPAVMNIPVATPAPPLLLTPALWMAFLAETKAADSAAHTGLQASTPLLDRPRHLVLCFGRNMEKVVLYMRKESVRKTLITILDELVGEGWTIEVLTSHFLDAPM